MLRDERGHGSKILKLGQQVFTSIRRVENFEEKEGFESGISDSFGFL